MALRMILFRLIHAIFILVELTVLMIISNLIWKATYFHREPRGFSKTAHMGSPSDGTFRAFIASANGMVLLGLMALSLIIGTITVAGVAVLGNKISSPAETAQEAPQQRIIHYPQNQEEEDFYHSLVQNAYQLQQDVGYGNSLLEKIVSGPARESVDLNKKEIDSMLRDSESLKQRINVDALKVIPAAPAGCSECPSQAETIKKDWKSLSEMMNRFNQELIFLDGLQAVREAQLKDLDEIPGSPSGTRMNEQDHVNRFKAQRQAYEKALNGYIALRPKAADAKAKDELESVINASQEVIKALDYVIDITPRHDNNLSNEAWKKVDKADAKEEREWNSMQNVLYDEFRSINNSLMNLQNPLDDFVSRLPQEENKSTNPEVSPANSVKA